MNNKVIKDNKNKIVFWEGFKKELPWLLFWVLLGVMTYGYYQDKQICDSVLADPCDACYKLNQTYVFKSYESLGFYNVTVNESILLYEDKNPNAKTSSNFTNW